MPEISSALLARVKTTALWLDEAGIITGCQPETRWIGRALVDLVEADDQPRVVAALGEGVATALQLGLTERKGRWRLLL
ncbi:MAG: hypothetical protein AAFV53_03325, partial [Myxococcota bacterium]